MRRFRTRVDGDRHQLPALANAGFHVAAPDLRGYGQSELPPEVASYNIMDLVGDMVGLVAALGQNHCIIVGHDWGATVAWGSQRRNFTATQEQPFDAGCASVRAMHPATGRIHICCNRAGACSTTCRPTSRARALAAGSLLPQHRPQLGTASALGRSRHPRGGPVHRRSCRPFNRFTTNKGPLEAMRTSVPNLQRQVLIEGAGHWIQQERPHECQQARRPDPPTRATGSSRTPRRRASLRS
jgi:pimeloyl-ACP methyl ester carboxylesterase